MSFVPVVPQKVSSPLVGVTSHPRMFVMPDLVSHHTFDLRIHEELPRAVWECKAWMINGSNISRSEEALDYLHGLKAGELGCACFPLVPFRKLRTCCDFLNWLFHLDDLSDDMDDKGTDAIGNEVMTTYRQPNAYDPKSTVGKLAKSFWTRIMVEGSPGFQKRFIRTTDLLFKAVTIQARDRAAGVVPGLEDYIDMRRDTSGCKICWTLIEYANDLDLPDEVMDHPIIQSLDEATNDLVAWSNDESDLFSYDREQAKGVTHNMIAIMMHHHGMALQEAVDFVGDLCKKSIDRFNEDRARLPSWGPEIDAQVQVYVQGLADWIVGSLHWSFESERYFGRKGGQIKNDLVVELAPIIVSEPVTSAEPLVVIKPGVRAS